MTLRRLHRLITAFVAVLSLLFGQLALAHYVCPEDAGLVDEVATMAPAMDPSLPCAGTDTEQPALCHAHAADAGQAFEALKLPTLSVPLVVQVIEQPVVVLHVPPHRAVLTAARSEGQAPPEPLFLSTLRLRV